MGGILRNIKCIYSIATYLGSGELPSWENSPCQAVSGNGSNQRQDLQSLAEEFADVYASSTSPCVTDVSLQLRSSASTACAYSSVSALDTPLTLRELQTALANLRKRCAAGPDGITNQMLLNLPLEFQHSLLEFFNHIWTTGDIPSSWKLAWVVPVPKPNKDTADLSSYRPVSLTSCVSKLMEKLVCARLMWWLEHRKKLPACMTGFRQRLSAQDSVLDLVSHLEHNRAYGLSTIAVFLDVAKAYDSVLPSAILSHLQEMGVTGHLLRFIRVFLTDRFMQVRIENVFSSKRTVVRGVPQGSVLSPILFNVAMSALPSTLKSHRSKARLSIYADDLCIWLTGYQTKRLHVIAQHAVSSVQAYLSTVGLV